jgi:hypothetical protein
MTTFDHLQGLVLRRAQVVCVVLATALLPVPAAQAQPVKVRYEVTTAVGPITDILRFTRYQTPTSGPFDDFWAFSVPAGGGSITDPRTRDLSLDPRAALMLGVLEVDGAHQRAVW